MSAHDRAERQSRYRLAATSLMRETTLDALRELLLERPWPTITMTDVAVAAGMSRQTIYKEFRSRRGLAEGYALRLTDSLVTVIESALYDNPDDVTTALRQGYATFFALSGADPLVLSLHQGSARGSAAPDHHGQRHHHPARGRAARRDVAAVVGERLPRRRGHHRARHRPACLEFHSQPAGRHRDGIGEHGPALCPLLAAPPPVSTY